MSDEGHMTPEEHVKAIYALHKQCLQERERLLICEMRDLVEQTVGTRRQINAAYKRLDMCQRALRGGLLALSGIDKDAVEVFAAAPMDANK